MEHPQIAATRTSTLKAIVLLCCAVLALAPWLDKAAETSISEALISTLGLYATVRGVDAVVSAAAGTELSLTPAGVGVTMAPGQLLEPLDDLIEQLGELLLWVLTIMSLENLSLSLLGNLWFRVGSGLFLLAAAGATLWWPNRQWPRVMRTGVVVLIVLRITLPLMAVCSELIAIHLVDARSASAESGLMEMTEDIAAEQAALAPPLIPEVAVEDQDLLQRLGNAMDGLSASMTRMSQSLALEKRMNNLSDKLDSGVRYVVDLLALITFRALIFPALFVFSIRAMMRLIDE